MEKFSDSSRPFQTDIPKLIRYLGKQSKISIFIEFSLFITLLIGMFYVGRYSQKPASTSPLVQTILTTPTQVPQDAYQPSVTPEKDTNWKSYTNSTIGYTVNIPANWSVQANKGVFLGEDGEAGFFPPGEEGDKYNKTAVYIVMIEDGRMIRYNLDSASELTEWQNKPVTTSENERQYKVGGVKVDGLDAVQFISQTLPGDPTEAYNGLITWFRKDSRNYYIELTNVTSLISRTQYNQIVSSFRFTR